MDTNIRTEHIIHHIQPQSNDTAFDYERDVIIFYLKDYINEQQLKKKDENKNRFYLKINRITGFGNLHMDFISKSGKGVLMTLPPNIPRAKELIEVQHYKIDSEIWTSYKQESWYNLGDVMQNNVSILKRGKRVIVNLWGYWDISVLP